MNLQSINESFKKIVHSTSYTNPLREALGEGAEGEKLELADGLFNAIRSLRGKGVSDMKTYEKAFQDVLERIFPEKDWFEVTSVNIFWDLMNTKDPEQTAINILADIYRPEETTETEETVEVTEDTVKRGGKWMNVGKDGSHGTFRTKKAADAHESVKNAKKPITEAVDTDDRRKALADHLGVDIETITTSRYDDKTFETEDGEEYLVLDSDEAREAAITSVKDTLDDIGIESFTDDFKEWAYRNAVETDWFDDALRESKEFYADDIESEDDNEYGTRLIHEMYDEGILEDDDFEKDEDGEIDYTRVKETVDIDSKKEDFVDKLVENMGDAVEWYRSEFGEDELARTVRDNDLIDADAVAEEAVDWDGVGHFLSYYDGKEIELDDGWYAYRTN